MTDYKLVPVEPTAKMVEAAEDAYMPFGDMELAIRMAVLAAPDHIAEARKKVSRPQIREAFLRNGARIEPDRDDLPDYVYESVFELLEMAAPAVQGEPVAVVDACDDDIWADILPDVTVKVGQTLYAAPQPAEQQPASRPWSYCPECGSEHAQHHEGEHKQCANCHQEWFSGTDYTDVVRKHLAGKFRDKDAEIERLRSSESTQPAPDVAGLIVLLEHAQCPNCDGSGARHDNYGEPEQCQWCHERAEALAAHRKGDE